MAANERAFANVPPGRLYLDTNVILDYLISTREHHERVKGFLRKVVDSELTAIFLSSLSWVEFTHVVRTRDFREKLSDDWLARFPLERWEELNVRQEYLRAMCDLLGGFLAPFDAFEISITQQVRQSAVSCMTEYGLDSQDAVHVAAAGVAGVRDLMSFDKGFRRVEGLYLWNDRIYGSEPV